MVERLTEQKDLIVDPTEGTPFTEGDYLHSVNEHSPFRSLGISYEDFSNSWLSTFKDMTLTPQRTQQFLGVWLEESRDEIHNSNPQLDAPIDFSQWSGDWQLSSHEPENYACPLPYVSTTNSSPLNWDLKAGEVFADMTPSRSARVDLPIAGGLLSLEYDTNSRVKLHAQIEDSHLKTLDGTTLATFDNTYVSLDSADIMNRLFGNSFLTKQVFDNFVDYTKSYHRLLKLEAVVVQEGKIKILIKPDVNPLFGEYLPEYVYVDLGMVAGGQGILGKIAKSGFNNTTNSTGYWKDEYENGNLGNGSGMINDLLPPDYHVGLWSRGLDASVSSVATKDGCMRLSSSSWGNAEIEASLPITIKWQGKTITGTINTRLQSDDSLHFTGWGEFYFDQLPPGFPYEAYGEFYWKNIVLDDEAWDLKTIFSKIIFGFEGSLDFYGHQPQIIEGGGVFVSEEGSQHLTLSAVNQSKEVFLPPALSTLDVDLNNKKIDFWTQETKLEVMPDVWLTVETFNGSVNKDDTGFTTEVDGIFKLSSKSSPIFTLPFTFAGKIVYNSQNQTLSLSQLDIPIHDLSFYLGARGHKREFIFNGRLKGSAEIDLQNKSLTGPLELDGELESPENTFPFFPGWISMNHDFALAARYEGVLYQPTQGLSAVALSGSRGGYAKIKDVHLSLQKLWQDQEDRSIHVAMDVSARPTQYVEDVIPHDDIIPEEEPVELVDEVPPPPVVIGESLQTLNDWDVYLAEYGLDNEKAQVMLDLSRHVRDGSFTIRNFAFTKKMVGPLTIPKGCEPILDIRIHDGKLAQFHFYFTRPLKFGLVDSVRGIYFDRETGSFRLDMMGHGDRNRPMNMYAAGGSDIKITRLLLGMLPLPDSVVDHLLDKAKINPSFLTDDTKGWLQFLFMALVAMSDAGDRRHESDLKKVSPINWQNTIIKINSLQFSENAKFKYGGVDVEFGCSHGNNPPDLLDANNSIRGQVTLADGGVHLEMATIGKLHIQAPLGDNKKPAFDIVLEDGDHGTLDLINSNSQSTLSLAGFTFRSASIAGEAKGGKINIERASNIRLNSLDIVRHDNGEREITTLSSDLDFNLSRGSLDFAKDNKAAHLQMEDSPMHLSTAIELEEVYGTSPQDSTVSGKEIELRKGRQRPMIFTVFKKGSWEVQSPSLYFSHATFTPDMEFEGSSLNRANIRLTESAELVPSLDIEGEFDWHSRKPLEIQLAKTPAIRKLNPRLTLNQIDLSGAGHLVFTGTQFHFEPSQNNETPLTLHILGRAGFSIPGSRKEMDSSFDADFENTQQITSGDLSIGKNHGSFPLFVEKLVLSDTQIELFNGSGIFNLATPTPKGASRIRFSKATGMIHFDGGLLESGNTLAIDSLSLRIRDHGPHKNSLNFDGAVGIGPGGLKFHVIHVKGSVYDELNDLEIPNLNLNSHPETPQ